MSTTSEKPVRFVFRAEDVEDVIVVGEELVCEKVLAIVNEALNMDKEIGLTSLMFRTDGYPEGVLGMAYPDTNSIAINLKEIWEGSCELAEKEENLSLRAIVWINLMSTLMHDLEHIRAGNRGRKMLEDSRKEDPKGLEKEADMYAKRMLVELAMKFDIEPPVMGEMGWFATRMMDLATGPDAEKDWVKRHVKLMEAGLIYHDPEPEEGAPQEIYTYRDYLKKTVSKLGLPEDMEMDWDQPTTAVHMIMNKEDGSVEVVNAEPVEEPKVQTAEAAEEAEVITEARVAAVMEAGMGLPGASVNSDQTEEPEPAVMAEVQSETDGMDAAAAQAALDNGQTVGDATPLFATAPPAETVVPDAVITPQGESIDMSQYAVPVPEAVQQAQTTTANARQQAVEARVRQIETTYPSNNVDPARFKAAMLEIYHMCYHHMMTKCERLQGGDVGFNAPANVLTPINITGVMQRHGVSGIIAEYDTHNAQGQYAAEKCENGILRGTIMKNANLPAYDLFLNFNGQCLVRRLVAQNPAKLKKGTNELSPSAARARAGEPIMWIIDRRADKWVGVIENNGYRELS